jgi:eukaryotic-like serine/threonine-protein kinase
MAEWKVPGYTEMKALGSGGFGEVMLARHDASGILVAIKYLRRDLLADTEFAEMFRGEATVLASLDDPNVVRLYEYVESPAGAAIVMELIGGVSLREILKFQGRTTAEAALVVLQGSLLGLAAAHRRGVVHRDYKPENVLVNGDGISKLTDFGIAARAGDHPLPAGTLPYAAPEQIAGAAASPAGDVYAATATFYECLTGRPPFTGDDADLIRQHRFDPVPLEPLPEALRPLVAAGMAKDPARRPANATTLVTELEAAAPGAYGQDWQECGRSHLGEAALLLAILWPAGAPPAIQGSAVDQLRLSRGSQASRESRHWWHFRHLWHIRHEEHEQHLRRTRRLRTARAAFLAGTALAVVAAGTALAATVATRPTSSHAAAVAQSVSLQPSTAPLSPDTGPGTPPSRAQASQSGPSPSQTQTSHSGPSPSQTQTSHSGPSPSQTQPSQSGNPGGSAPVAPSDLAVTAAGPDDIDLSWQVNSSDQTGFEISNGVTSTDVGADSTSYTWGGLSPGTYMCFKILAYNSAGDSAWYPDVSPWYVCTTTPGSSSPSPSPEITAPAAPSDLTVTAAGPDDIDLSWQVNSSDQTGFEISNGVTSTDVGADSTSYTWGGLSPGTYMCFKILAYNSAGDSAWDPDVSPWYVCTTTPSSGSAG